MSLVRCPACQTVFRLQAAQLDAHGGMVRCGHCFVPFNARLNLVDHEVKHAAAATPEASAATVTPAAAPLDVRERPSSAVEKAFFVLEDPAPEAAAIEEPPSFAAALDALRRDDFVRPTAPPAVFRPRSEAERRPAMPEMQDEPAAELTDPLAFGVPEALPPERVESPQQEHFDQRYASQLRPSPRAPEARREPGALLPPELAAHFTLPERSAERLPDDEPAEHLPSAAAKEPPVDEAAALAREDDPVPADFASARDFVKRHPVADEEDDDAIRARYRPTGAAPPDTGGRWLLGLTLGMLMGLLAGQGAYLFRSEIARQWPQTRPHLELMCAYLACTLGLPKVIDEILIESSDLEVAPGERSSHVLNALIRNRADFPQTVPHLELTLTDARDRAVIRRVLSPAEWLRGGAPEAGLAPRSTVPVRLGFNTAGVENAVGYRLYLFYP